MDNLINFLDKQAEFEIYQIISILKKILFKSYKIKISEESCTIFSYYLKELYNDKDDFSKLIDEEILKKMLSHNNYLLFVKFSNEKRLKLEIAKAFLVMSLNDPGNIELIKKYENLSHIKIIKSYFKNESENGILYEEHFTELSKILIISKIKLNDILNVINFLIDKNIKKYEQVKCNLEKVSDFDSLNKLKQEKIFNHLYNYQNCMKNGDKEEMLKELEFIGFDFNLVQRIKIYLNSSTKEIELNQRKETKINLKKETKTNIKSSKLSKPNKFELENELRKVYDLDTRICLKVLSLDEIIYYLNIFKQLTKDSGEINSFLKKAEYKLMKADILFKYKSLINKFKYYEDSIDFKGKIEELENYFNKAFENLDEDSEIIKELMDILMEEITDMIPPTYEYEYNCLKLKNN